MPKTQTPPTDQPELFDSTALKISSATVLDALAREYIWPWMFFRELRIGTGYGRDAEQRIDAYALHPHPSMKFGRLAFEIKISRADFLREKRAPLKRRYALAYASGFYFVTLPDVVKDSTEIPPDCGWIVFKDGQLTTRIAAPERDPLPPTWRFVASLLRHSEALSKRAMRFCNSCKKWSEMKDVDKHACPHCLQNWNISVYPETG